MLVRLAQKNMVGKKEVIGIDSERQQSWENNPKSPTQPSHPQVSNKFEYFFSRRLKSVAGIRGPHPFGEVGKG